MSSAVLEEEIRPALTDTDNEDFYDEYYEEDRELYESPKFNAIMQEVMAEEADIMAHPEKYKFYTSTKEMFRDMGFDVSNLPDH